MVAADTGFYSLKNERTIQAMGVRRVAVHRRSTKSSERRELRTRWFRAGQRWRTGCEGRISVLKRRHGLSRCRYRGFEGMQRWVGLELSRTTSSRSAAVSLRKGRKVGPSTQTRWGESNLQTDVDGPLEAAWLIQKRLYLQRKVAS
jgi:Transposase DDE domain